MSKNLPPSQQSAVPQRLRTHKWPQVMVIDESLCSTHFIEWSQVECRFLLYGVDDIYSFFVFFFYTDLSVTSVINPLSTGSSSSGTKPSIPMSVLTGALSVIPPLKREQISYTILERYTQDNAATGVHSVIKLLPTRQLLHCIRGGTLEIVHISANFVKSPFHKRVIWWNTDGYTQEKNRTNVIIVEERSQRRHSSGYTRKDIWMSDLTDVNIVQRVFCIRLL